MKKLFACFISVVAVVFTFQAQADLLDGWDFATLSTGTANPTTISATVGTGALDLSAFSGTENTNFAGTTLNAFPGGATDAGEALSIVGSTANGKAMIFSFDMAGYTDLVLSFATRGTSTGFDTHTWAWSTDGINYTSLSGVAANKTSTWSTETVNFGSVLDNVTTAYVSLTVSGATSGSGNNRLDNIQFNATSVPEPSTFALATLGGVACLFALRRKS